MKEWLLYISLIMFLAEVSGQDCTILSKANSITPDRLCSPVSVTWKVVYTGVNNAGRPVRIRFDWDNGTVIDVNATQTAPGVFEATAVNVYTSRGRICNYHPQATLVVNGVLCTSSSQEQIVTVWDDDDHNGGIMRINPEIYPICFGNSANVRFQDLTQFNCVPPQERDNPNLGTRWIQWIYGTDNTMTGTPVTIDGRRRTFPYRDDIVTLTGPVTGSGVWSDVINVAADKLVGEYFEVTLRNWNYCNPYDDPNIPGPPADRINGDHPPVVTTAKILIVAYPDATITPVGPFCANAPAVALTAVDAGGVWTGAGVTGDIFNPAIAGPGDHLIKYTIVNASGCRDMDETTITVYPVPNAKIIAPDIVCSTDAIITLRAYDSGGTWSGDGVTGDTFDPLVNGPGSYLISYTITDANGCTGSDTKLITVATPDATITPVDTLCIDSAPVTLMAHDLGGTWTGPGVAGDVFYPEVAGIGSHLIRYELANPACSDADSTVITVVPLPVVILSRVGTLFINSPPVTVKANIQGGVLYGPGITGDVFDPAAAGIGTHVITYETIPDRHGCMGQDTINIRVLMPPPPIADFRPDTAGCSPLTVHFINKSIYGETYYWDFGDNVFSNEENPVHTYYVPGNYIAKLIVYSIAGQAVHSTIIQVFQNPSSIFNAYPTDVINNQQIVVFYNYSHYDSQYLWDFGDGNTSTEKNPYHKYKEPGSYEVSLTVISKDGCVDSSVLETPIRVEWKEGVLRFPNVFKWNETGPTGGYWTEGLNPQMDFVFRPFFENVIEYKLQIFNRWGVLIYESNDLYKGWDGYSRDGNLAVQGVYVWKVTGRYADGKYFDQVGDVTFLH